jgi:hypothetical protein
VPPLGAAASAIGLGRPINNAAHTAAHYRALLLAPPSHFLGFIFLLILDILVIYFSHQNTYQKLLLK